MVVASLTLMLLLISCVVDGFKLTTFSPVQQRASVTLSMQRRELLPIVTALIISPLTSNAFDNAIPDKAKYKDRPKQRGPKPSDLGVLNRGESLGDGLKTCSPGVNCFTTSGDPDFDKFYLLSPWAPPKNADNAIEQITAVINEYPPGQNGIDGGGFKVIKSDSNYVYTQFESLKNTYIDDVEFAKTKDNTILVRSSSRLGYLDYGVNTKRLNWISKKLRDNGWTAPEITPRDFPDYFTQNAQK